MVDTTNEQLQNSITWEFTVFEQGQSSRYGMLNGTPYKQYTPNGNIFPDAYPPKRISSIQYERARRFHGYATKNSGG